MSESICNIDDIKERRRRMSIKVPADIKITTNTPLKYKAAKRTGRSRPRIMTDVKY